MRLIIKEIRHNRLLWLLVFVPVLFVAQGSSPTRTPCCSCFLSRRSCRWPRCSATRPSPWPRKTGDTVGGLLNATLGNLTELVIALTALHAGQYMLVKASIAGAIVTNTLVHAGHVVSARRAQASRPGIQPHQRPPPGQPAVSGNRRAADSVGRSRRPIPPRQRKFTQTLSVGLSVLLIVAYGLGLVFSLKTHREFFERRQHGGAPTRPWPMGLALATLGGRHRAGRACQRDLRRVGAAGGETLRHDSCLCRVHRRGAGGRRGGDGLGVFRRTQEPARPERRHRAGQRRPRSRSLSLRCSCFSATSIGPSPMDLQFWPGAVAMMLIATLTAALVTNARPLGVVRRSARS